MSREADFMVGYWPKMRAGDNLESVYWLYNRTGEAWLLELAEQDPPPHGRLDQRRARLARREHRAGLPRAGASTTCRPATGSSWTPPSGTTSTVMGLYGQFPGGGFAGDENCRPGYGDPRQGFETCSIVEFMHSFEMLTQISGNPLWADRCEEIAFNSLPAALTPDLKALHYLTGAEHGAARPAEQVPRHPERRHDVLLQPRRRLPLLPAQRLAWLALLRRGAVAGHGRQRPVRFAVCRLRSDGQRWATARAQRVDV